MPERNWALSVAAEGPIHLRADRLDERGGWLEVASCGRTYRILAGEYAIGGLHRVLRLDDAGPMLYLWGELHWCEHGLLEPGEPGERFGCIVAALRQPDGSYRECLRHDLWPITRMHPDLTTGPSLPFTWTPPAGESSR